MVPTHLRQPGEPDEYLFVEQVADGVWIVGFQEAKGPLYEWEERFPNRESALREMTRQWLAHKARTGVELPALERIAVRGGQPAH